MIKKNPKTKYFLLIVLLILLIYISLFSIYHYPFTDITNQEIISFFKMFFAISIPLTYVFCLNNQSLITLLGSIVSSITILFLITNIVSMSENFPDFVYFCMLLAISIFMILSTIYNVKKGNLVWFE